MTQELIPLSLVQRCLTPSALFPLAEQSGGGERDFLYLHTLGRDCLQRVVSAETVLTPSTSGKCRAGYDTKNQTFINMQAKLSCTSVWNEAEMCTETVIYCTKCSKFLLASLTDLVWMKSNYCPALCSILPMLVSFSCCLEDKLCLPYEKCALLCFQHTPHNEPFARVVSQAVSARLPMTKWRFNESNGIRHT